MTYQYCTEQVVNTGITDVTKFNAEVQKCLANPVTYPPPSLATSTPSRTRHVGARHLLSEATGDEPLLRHTVFVGLREDKPARVVRREVAIRP
jgi:hypothetical protein